MQEQSDAWGLKGATNPSARSRTNLDLQGPPMLARVCARMTRRFGQVQRLWKENGGQHVLNRVRSAIAERMSPITPQMPVRPADVLALDVGAPRTWTWRAIAAEEPLVINWVTTPPYAGSGGHTTIFRLIRRLQELGNRCHIYFYDVYGGDTSEHRARTFKLFPWFAGEANDVADGMRDAHAVIATAWQTAYPSANDRCRGKRFYFVQDFEPWFYAPGARSGLAENTYRMGFHGLTAGRFLAGKLKAEYGMDADSFDFGCDTEHYHVLNTKDERDAIAFYTRPETPRRAFELGLMALQLFAERHPHIKIHFYGSRVGKLPFLAFPFVDHGGLAPDALNRIYNRCFAGLSLSMTNVSLVPHEMLAAGCIPVVNDAEHNRVVLNNPFVRYAPPDPHALANALGDVVTTPYFTDMALAASASVAAISWDDAGVVLDRCMRRALLGKAKGNSGDSKSGGLKCEYCWTARRDARTASSQASKTKLPRSRMSRCMNSRTSWSSIIETSRSASMKPAAVRFRSCR